jgi:hypothetical protein
MNEIFSLIAAIFSAIATGFAAWATWHAPVAAATLAETLRRDTERNQERRRQKFEVFSALMQERLPLGIYSENGVRALNVIDVVFNDSRPVREAWALYYYDVDPRNNVPPHMQKEHLRQLLAAIANDIGFGDEFRIEDFDRIYLPTPLYQDRLIRDIERQQLLARLQQGQMQPAANVAPPQGGVWPPPPTR